MTAPDPDPEPEPGPDPVERLRDHVRSRGASGAIGVRRLFLRMDENGSGRLGMDEFRRGVNETGCGEFTEEETKIMFEKFDKNESGTLDVKEFLLEIRVNIFPTFYSHQHVVQFAVFYLGGRNCQPIEYICGEVRAFVVVYDFFTYGVAEQVYDCFVKFLLLLLLLILLLFNKLRIIIKTTS